MEVMGWKKAFLVSSVGGDYGELGRGVRDVSDFIGSNASDTCC